MDLFVNLFARKNLEAAWKRIRSKNARGGIDGLRPEDMEDRISRVITRLSEELAAETYVPAPLERLKVPKFNPANEWRSLSLPVVTDKIVQQAFVNVCAPVFEKQFLDSSYAYRPKKGPVKAVGRISHILRSSRPGWIVNFDIDNCFDTFNHDRIIEEFEKTVSDPRMLDLIRLWLKAGYIGRRGRYEDPRSGIAQGAVLSPLLSNIYLHDLDCYARDSGWDYVRYSDNFICLCADESGAQQCHESMNQYVNRHLLMQLNREERPIRPVGEGFAFLGIWFRGEKRSISREKIQKSIRKMNRLTHPGRHMDPAVVRERINDRVRSQKRFYGYIRPERQFAAFDRLLMKGLTKMLSTFTADGRIKTRKEIEDYIRQIEFYLDRDEAWRRDLSGKIAQLAMPPRQETVKTDPSGNENSIRRKQSGSRRSGAVKNRYLRMAAGEAELIISTPGVFIGKTGNRLVVRQARKNIREQPVADIRQITVTGKGVTLSSDVIWFCGVNRVPMSFLNRQGNAYAVLQHPTHSLGDLSIYQIRMYETEKAFNLARRIIEGKCRNQMNLLKFYGRHRSGTDPVFSERLSGELDAITSELDRIRTLSFDGNFAEIRNRLFTAEARVSLHYWGVIKLLLPDELNFEKRIKQGASDVINNMLNYGYAILYQRIWNALSKAGFNPNIGFIHVLQKNKPTMTYDVIEEFRQALVDRPIFSLMTRGTRYRKLRVDPKTGLLDACSKETALHAVLNRLATLINYRGKKIRAEDVIEQQTGQLAEYIRDRRKTYRPFISTY